MKLIVAASFVFNLVQAMADEPTPMNFPKRRIQVGNQFVEAEIADTEGQMERGLMYRRDLQDNAGMLFVYPNEQMLSFWMKNTYIPLAIGFFDRNKKLVDVQEMAATSEIQTNLPTYQSKKPAQYALEEPANWFTRHHISLGATLKFETKNAPNLTTAAKPTSTSTAPAKALSTKAQPPKAGH